MDADELCTNRGCCGAGARTRLTQAARTQLESALWSELSKLADTLTNRAIKFDAASGAGAVGSCIRTGPQPACPNMAVTLESGLDAKCASNCLLDKEDRRYLLRSF
uniref:SFRICE_001581 n=1 Tax=Spodoptera frugiperda TaxID=7108 RepID=A0A2H1VEK5_SPOFR